MLLRSAWLISVTSAVLHDGIYLVAPEYSATRINPYETERVAETLRQALEMSPEEKAHRMARLQEYLSEHNIYNWLVDVFTTLAHIREGNDNNESTALSAWRYLGTVLQRAIATGNDLMHMSSKILRLGEE